MTPTSLRIAVVPDGEREMRSVHALAAHPAVAQIGIVGRPAPVTWRNVRRIESVDGWDAVLGPDDQAIDLAAAAGIAAIVPGAGPGPDGTVTHASLEGLARALAVVFDLGDHARLVATTPGSPERRGPAAGFPQPLGMVTTSGPAPVEIAPVDGAWAGVLAGGAGGSIAVVDDRAFLEAVCLAAGAACLTGRGGPVWGRAHDYVAWARQMGLVIGGA